MTFYFLIFLICSDFSMFSIFWRFLWYSCLLNHIWNFKKYQFHSQHTSGKATFLHSFTASVVVATSTSAAIRSFDKSNHMWGPSTNLRYRGIVLKKHLASIVLLHCEPSAAKEKKLDQRSLPIKGPTRMQKSIETQTKSSAKCMQVTIKKSQHESKLQHTRLKNERKACKTSFMQRNASACIVEKTVKRYKKSRHASQI